MLKIAKHNSLACISFAMIFAQLFFPIKSFADEYASNNEVIKEIEKTLLFDKESRQKLDVYEKRRSSKKSDYTINTSDNSLDEKSDSKVEIIAVDTKSENFGLREKEKLAYNASTIGQYEVAVELYKQIIAAEPENSYSKFSLALIYQKLGQISQAKTIYRDLLKTNPENEEEIVGNLLAILIEESPKDALYLLSRLTAQNPKSAYILAQSAIVYDKMKKYDQAIALLNRAVVLEPKNYTYKYNLAVIYDKSSQSDKALELYSEVAANYSDNNQLISIEQIQKRIQTIKSKI